MSKHASRRLYIALPLGLWSAKTISGVLRITGAVMLRISIVVLCVINVSLSIRTRVPSTPSASVLEHATLARQRWSAGDRAAAQRHIRAMFTYDSIREHAFIDVLGVARVSVTESRDVDRRRSLEANYNLWQTILAQHPDYRDGHIALATLAYQLGKPKEARLYITAAKKIDPNNTTIASLEGLLPSE